MKKIIYLSLLVLFVGGIGICSAEEECVPYIGNQFPTDKMLTDTFRLLSPVRTKNNSILFIGKNRHTPYEYSVFFKICYEHAYPVVAGLRLFSLDNGKWILGAWNARPRSWLPAEEVIKKIERQ